MESIFVVYYIHCERTCILRFLITGHMFRVVIFFSWNRNSTKLFQNSYLFLAKRNHFKHSRRAYFSKSIENKITSELKMARYFIGKTWKFTALVPMWHRYRTTTLKLVIFSNLVVHCVKCNISAHVLFEYSVDMVISKSSSSYTDVTLELGQ